MSDVPHRMRLRNGIRTVNGLTGETEPTYGEYVLATDYDALQSTLASRDAEIAALRTQLMGSNMQLRQSNGDRLAIEHQVFALRKSLDSKGEALLRAHQAMIGVNIFVTTREKINDPTGTQWWHAEMDACGDAARAAIATEVKP